MKIIKVEEKPKNLLHHWAKNNCYKCQFAIIKLDGSNDIICAYTQKFYSLTLENIIGDNTLRKIARGKCANFHNAEGV